MKTSEIDAVTRGLAPDPSATRITAEAWSELGEDIMAESTAAAPASSPAAASPPDPATSPVAVPASRGPRVRRLVLAGAFTLLVLGIVGATVINRPNQNQAEALSVTARGDHLIIRVVDPTADPKRYNAELKKLGLHITVRSVPVSPPFVGVMVSFSGRNEKDMGQLHRLEAGELCNGTLNASDPGCQEGLEVPKNYDGETEIQFGRAAKPGELYFHFSSNIDDPGEAMHGAQWKDRTIAEVKQVLAERKLKVSEYYDASKPRDAKAIATPPDDWYVRDASEYVAGEVTLYVSPTK